MNDRELCMEDLVTVFFVIVFVFILCPFPGAQCMFLLCVVLCASSVTLSKCLQPVHDRAAVMNEGLFPHENYGEPFLLSLAPGDIANAPSAIREGAGKDCLWDHER